MAHQEKQLIGAHTSTAGGLEKSVERATALKATTMQIFTKSNRKWFETPLPQESINRFVEAVNCSPLKSITVHGAYLINLASSNPEVEKKSVTSLTKELERCGQLKIPYFVLHPGSHTGSGEEKGIAQIAKNLDIILEKIKPTTKILLETMAGQGTNLGSTFEQLQAIITQTKNNKYLGVCLDTCHIFSAGYDISTEKGYKETLQTFDKLVGLDKLHIIHLNDSKTACGSKKDRHEELGKGAIPLEVFKWIMQDKQLSHVAKILETPNPDLYAQEIAQLRAMC